MIICSILTAAVVITVGTLICTSDEGDYAASVLSRIDSEKQLRSAAETQKLINKKA
ncbi:MAG: hypothetical protein IKH13_04810 [Clostridia bacterium]|nr:hypothetical protein [Clostridia bacterium]